MRLKVENVQLQLTIKNGKEFLTYNQGKATVSSSKASWDVECAIRKDATRVSGCKDDSVYFRFAIMVVFCLSACP